MTQDTFPIVLPVCEITISQELIDAYAHASGDFNTVHVDPAAGRAAGFGGTIAHGCIPLEPVFKSIQTWLGTETLPADTALRLRYHAPSRPGDLIRVHARVVRAANDGTLSTVEFACRNQHDTVVIDGEWDLQQHGGTR
ncbi:hypothetical protein GG851_18455 [Bordetella petrii]|nr:hypothetical protein [Bordetella petrii]